MNHHLLFYRATGRFREYRRHLSTRRAYCLLAIVTYTNSLLFAWMMFRQHELAVDILFCLASCLIGVSVTGLYLSKPLIMLPDVVYKILLATCAFFFAVKEADEGKEGATYCLLFVLIGYGLQFYENYFLFNAMLHLYRKTSPVLPPPSYQFFTVTAPPKDLQRSKHEDVEEGVGTSSEQSVHTPPPSYAAALANMARKMALVPGSSSPAEAVSPAPPKPKAGFTMSIASETDSLPPSERAEGRRFEILMQTSSLP